eukprot:TRINITY_DN825_c0_g2_i2.p1 TRINITY_DN825_c0_g2~~TRINITY_DN825_c0_g2_i2.p1  ORF type:complete len:359 (-),score=71.59 TRINITY_DN825_c0_g2_i2:59-1135(-)
MIRRGGAVLYSGLKRKTTCKKNLRHVIKRRSSNVVRRDQNDIAEILKPVRESNAADSFLHLFNSKNFGKYLKRQTSLYGIPGTVILGMGTLTVPAALVIAMDRSKSLTSSDYNVPLRPTNITQGLDQQLVEIVAPSPTLLQTLFRTSFNAGVASFLGLITGFVFVRFYWSRFVDLNRIGVPHTRPFLRHIRDRAYSASLYGAVATSISAIFASVGLSVPFFLPQILQSEQTATLNESSFRANPNTPTQYSVITLTTASLTLGLTCFVISAIISPFGFVPAVGAWVVGGTALIAARMVGLEGENGYLRGGSRNLDAYQVAHPEAVVHGSVVALAAQYERREEARRLREGLGHKEHDGHH